MGVTSGPSDEKRWIHALLCRLPPVELTNHQRYLSPSPRYDYWATSRGSLLWIWLVDIGRWQCRRTLSQSSICYKRRSVPISGNAPATFERLMDRVLCGMRWSRCLVYLDDVISFGASISEALARLEEVLCRLSDFGLQLKAKKCTFMQTEVAFLGHIVGRTGLACDPEKISAVQYWHAPSSVKGVCQFVGFIGYYHQFVRDFAGLSEPLVALTRKGVPFVRD